jgi:hypothetical protein
VPWPSFFLLGLILVTVILIQGWLYLSGALLTDMYVKCFGLFWPADASSHLSATAGS